MRYDYIRAEQFCDSVRDGTHDTPKPTENGYKLVTGKHIRDGRVDPTEAYYISEKDYNKINERSRVDQWDVLMSMIGNGLGRSAIVYDNPNYFDKGIYLKTWDDHTILEYKERVNVLRRIVGKRFGSIDHAVFADTYNLVERQLREDYIDAIEYYSVYKKLQNEDIASLFSTDPSSITTKPGVDTDP